MTPVAPSGEQRTRLNLRSRRRRRRKDFTVTGVVFWLVLLFLARVSAGFSPTHFLPSLYLTLSLRILSCALSVLGSISGRSVVEGEGMGGLVFLNFSHPLHLVCLHLCVVGNCADVFLSFFLISMFLTLRCQHVSGMWGQGGEGGGGGIGRRLVVLYSIHIPHTPPTFLCKTRLDELGPSLTPLRF